MTECYSFRRLESRSMAKMTAFLPAPLKYHFDKDAEGWNPEKDAEVPGCGPAAIKTLNENEIFTLHQFCGQFMLLDRDVEKMIKW